MKNSKFIHILSLFLAFLTVEILCVGCGGKKEPTDLESGTVASDTQPGEGTKPHPETGNGTEAETDVGTEPETEKSVTLQADTLSVGEDWILLTTTTDIGEEGVSGQTTVSLSTDAEGTQMITTARGPLSAGTAEWKLTCTQEELNGTLYLTVRASDGEEVWDSLFLCLKDHLPQLTPDGIKLVVAAMTNEEKAHMVTGVPDPTLSGASGGTYPIERLGIPSITVNDGPAGVRYGTAVWYPSIMNISSSWDPVLAARVGQAIGEDALAIGMDVVLGPGMNIQKNVLGGRNFEYSSEDPILTGLMMSAYVQGMQSTGTGACIKHFAVNNQESSRGSVSANVTERALREIYLKGFGMVVRDASPWTVMSSYNCLNGIHTSVNSDLLTGILRDEFGFDGFVMSDWGAVGSMVDKVMAMNDVNMPGNVTDSDDVLVGLADGLITPVALDACCANILRVVVRSSTYLDKQGGRVDYISQNNLNKEIAADTMVLLKNQDGALPYSGKTSLAVFGNGASNTVFGGSGSGVVSAKTTESILAAIRHSDTLSVYDLSHNPFVNCAPHDPLNPDSDVMISDELISAWATGADAALIVISRNTTEGEDLSILAGSFALSNTETQMIQRVSSAFHEKGKTVTVVLNTGNPIEVVSWRDLVDGIIWCGYAGQMTGTGLERILTGQMNPSAKLAMTWPATYESTPTSDYFPGNANDTLYYEDIYVGYRYYNTFGVDTAYEFGYGLSYTSFGYSDCTLQEEANGDLYVIARVTNEGKVAGREIVQLYVSKPETTQEQASRELVGFAKTALLEPGESEVVKIAITPDALETYDTKNSRWIIDKGEFRFSLADSLTGEKASFSKTWDKAVVLSDVENRCVPDTALTVMSKETYTVPDRNNRPVNLALGKEAWADYSENDQLKASYAVDGAPTTRWSGLGTTNAMHTWQVDLGQVYSIGKVVIQWESLSIAFMVQISNDGENFTSYTVLPPDASCVNTFNLHGTEARYIRLVIPKSGNVSIYEFQAYEAIDEDLSGKEDENKTENVALGKPVTSTDIEGNYRNVYANDGNLMTRWGSLPTGEAWLCIDLEALYNISGLTMYLESAWVPYHIQYSVDGQTFTTLYQAKKDELQVNLTDLNIKARYIRMERDGENWFSIMECMVFGTESTG